MLGLPFTKCAHLYFLSSIFHLFDTNFLVTELWRLVLSCASLLHSSLRTPYLHSYGKTFVSFSLEELHSLISQCASKPFPPQHSQSSLFL